MTNKMLAPRSFSEAGWNVINWKEVEKLYDGLR
jgi:superoxide dismutase